MKVCIQPSQTGGSVSAVASKSVAHRLLICAAFADCQTTVRCDEINEDIEATVRCLNALGAKIERNAPFYTVSPVQTLSQKATLNCGESGSTLRFLLPVVCMLGVNASFEMSGRLPQRPLSPLREELERGGISFSEVGTNPMTVNGRLSLREFSISGRVSSQFISGLLFALAISGETGTVTLTEPPESAPYVDMTVHALQQFGIQVASTDREIKLTQNNGLRTPDALSVEGDWSSAAFPLCLGAVGKQPVTVSGLNPTSAQGDKAILDLLRQFGAEVLENGSSVTVSPAPLHGISVNASQIPDLVPVVATVASVASGSTVISGAARLRLKESDRLFAVRSMLNDLGADVVETSDGLIIHGKETLLGGNVSSFGDHRIAMSAAVASVACLRAVSVDNPWVTAKSYPRFWEDMQKLGMHWTTCDGTESTQT